MRIGVTNRIRRSCPCKSVQIYRKCDFENDIYFVRIKNGSFNKTRSFMGEKVKLLSLLARKDITEQGMINNPTNQYVETFINATFNDSPKIQP